jgi:hypothetical protein
MNSRMSAVLAAVILVAVSGVSAAQEPGCRATDENAEGFRDYAVQLATEQSPEMIQTRQTYGIVAVPETEVQIVTDRQTCAAAARKYKHALGEHGKSDRLVYVVRIGERYVVYDPDEKAGEFTVHMVFDKHFKLLATFAG